MKRFKNILAVLSNATGDINAVDQAAAVAKRNKAKLTIMEAIDNSIASPKYLDERNKNILKFKASIRRNDIEAETVIQTGTPYLQITRQVLRENHDLLIIAAETNRGFKNLFFGSTSLHLMRNCPCPIWVLKPKQKGNYSRILAAVDLSPDDVDADDLNIKIMDLATSLATINKSELHIFFAWEFMGNDLDTMRSETTKKIRERLIHKNRSIHQKAFDQLLARYDLESIEHKVHLVRGNPGFLLPKMAKGNKIDLFVMGTVRRTGIPGFLMGSTAEHILGQVECSVLTVKPEKFVTPVEPEDD